MSKHITRLALVTVALVGCTGLACAKSVDPNMEQAMYSETTSQSDAQSRIQDARDSVDGAKSDVSDAQSQLAALEHGDYSDIVIVSEGEVSKCGKADSYPGCKPLTDADKQDAKAEAQKTLSNARQELASAEADLEHIQKIKSADAH